MAYRRYRRYRNTDEDPLLSLFSVLLIGSIGLIYVNRYKIFLFIKSIFNFVFIFASLAGLLYLVSKLYKIRSDKTISDSLQVDAQQESVIASEVKIVPTDIAQIPEPKEESRYKLNDGLVTPTEEKFMKILEEVVGDKYRIVPQVQLSRIMKPVDSNKHFTNYKDFNLIKAKSIDFVLYDKDLKNPYVAIELDDRSHWRWDRRKRDEFVNRIMQEVGLRLIRVPVSRMYNRDWLREEIYRS